MLESQPGTQTLARLERAIQGDLLNTPAIQRLLWIPGIGRIVVFTLALEVDDIQRFPTVHQFWSFCRLVPGAADSGAAAGLNHESRRLIGKPAGHAEVTIWDAVERPRSARLIAIEVEPRMVFDRHSRTVADDRHRLAPRDAAIRTR